MPENNVIEENWTGIILQWLFLFGLLLIPVLSGMLFRKLAKQYQQQGWKLFIIGILVFFIGLALGALMENLIISISESPEDGLSISGLLRLPSGILFSAVLYFVFKRIWARNKHRL